MEYLQENWMVIITTIISVASVIAKVTPNQTDNQYVAMAQKVVDALAMSSAPTKQSSKDLDG